MGAINAHSVDKICSLMTSDHIFIDSQGNTLAGAESMQSAWAGYFQLFPDYAIEITEVFAAEDGIGAFGFAAGTYKGVSGKEENHWRLPAAWKAVIVRGKIRLWQVYADAKIPSDIIAKNMKQ